ncbi:hypothetical protein C8J56DRAFT_1172609 [Mycena floridula]|nr:hypothetical protein C8J56DRAFT_1172609 [Mycena floridula]
MSLTSMSTYSLKGSARAAVSSGTSQRVASSQPIGIAPSKPRAGAKAQVRPTHFLSLSLSSHVSLHQKMTAFREALLEKAQDIPGLDASIITDPVRLHITIGVMKLASPNVAVKPPKRQVGTAPETDSPARSGGSIPAGTQTLPPEPTIKTALSLLESIKSQLILLMDRNGVTIPLEQLGYFKGRNKSLARVLWVGPDDNNNVERKKLEDVCQLVLKTFKDAGYVTDSRPLKLHCTIINTTTD